MAQLSVTAGGNSGLWTVEQQLQQTHGLKTAYSRDFQTMTFSTLGPVSKEPILTSFT